MSHKNIIRAWKDEAYRLSLSEAELAALPEHPAGVVELGEAELGVIDGGLLNTAFICGTDGPGCTWLWCYD
jgi:mersacidin/lichenicidin family type 2 lantibiotic